VAELKGADKGRQTQWATQFLAAAELIRRGYTVSLTQGNNAPVADLMVGSSSSKLFWVDVKGLSSKNAWLITPKDSRDELFYILVLLSPLMKEPEKRTADRFFVLKQAEANDIEAAYRRSHPQMIRVRSGASRSSTRKITRINGVSCPDKFKLRHYLVLGQLALPIRNGDMHDFSRALSLARRQPP
jgi:hypothetical protein